MNRKDKLSPQQKKALAVFSKKLDGRIRTYLNSCVRCGLCADSCHYFLADNNEDNIPAKKIELISKIFRRYHTFSGKIFPSFVKAKDLNDETTEEMIDILFGTCSMCGRCTMHCSVGVDISLLVRSARSMFVEMGLVPKGLQSTIDAAINTGNNMAIPRVEFIDTLDWLEEDLQLELEDDNASIPRDKKGKRVLYTLNPREPKFFPLSISAMAKIYYTAKEDWSISTNTYDVTNYAYYSGDDAGAQELTQRLYDETAALGAEVLVLAECGHGSRSIRWEGPNWIEKPYPFKVITVIEIIAEYIRAGRIKLDPSKSKDLVTLHDPCNLVRSGGIIEEQRFILNKAVENFVEMIPNRTDNYCCGGGGGQLSMSEYNDRRIQAGKIKAEQIRNTGAKIVATPCHNCIDQLMEINNIYKLGVEIKTIGEIVADSLIINN